VHQVGQWLRLEVSSPMAYCILWAVNNVQLLKIFFSVTEFDCRSRFIQALHCDFRKPVQSGSYICYSTFNCGTRRAVVVSHMLYATYSGL
jgi:hypothetical protein